jgi:alpha-glutamyl/putrescinyl thymine pyrophosphorylase clade 1
MRIFYQRAAGIPGPRTADPILARHKFTNVYQAADRVSQHLIRHVIYAGSQDPEEVVLRVLLIKFFNRIETWELLSPNGEEKVLRCRPGVADNHAADREPYGSPARSLYR